MHSRVKLSGMAASSAAVLVLWALPASAATVVIHDPAGDAPGGYDLTRTVYRNAPHRISVKAQVLRLQRERARFAVTFGPRDNPDLGFMARTYLSPDGSVKTPQNLYISREGSPLRIRCDVHAVWRLALADTVSLSVPRRCIKMHLHALEMQASISRSGADTLDSTHWTRVQRG
jgi:hypothetical protein